MICPRCSVAEISAETNRCVLCGYAPGGAGGAVGTQVQPREELHDYVQAELGQIFQLERLLSTGPRTQVYAAREIESERKVALKVLARQPVREAGMEDRFTRDAAAAASLDHPHIVPIYRFGATAHLLWYSMKFIEGRTLADILRETGPLELHACLRIVEQVASALQYAHRRGITHGDIRPGNVIVDAQEWALVTDFAIGRVLERIPGRGGESDSPARPPEYVAPEESYARQPGPGADQFALAVLVYEALAGERPSQPPQPLVAVRPEIPVPLAEALLRAMHPQPTARFMNVMELVSVLGAGDPAVVPAPRSTPRPSANQRVLFVDGPARSRRWIWMGIGTVVGLAAVGYALLQIASAPAESTFMSNAPATGSSAEGAVPPPPPAPPPAPTPAPVTTQPRPTTTAAPPISRPAPTPRVAPVPGHLFINSNPWGQLYIDGTLVGNTPFADLEIAAGTHKLRVVRQGFQAFEIEVEVAPGQQLRLTDIKLLPGPPSP